MKNIKTIIIFIMIVFAYFWIWNYEKQTIKLENKIDNIELNVDKVQKRADLAYDYAKFNDYRITYQDEDYLIVPDKPIDYWKDEKSNNKVIKTIIKSETNINYNVDIDEISNYIKEKEGFHSKPYRDGCLIKAKNCPSKYYRYSNGYGTLAKNKNEIISKKEAEKRLVEHINKTIYPKLKNVKFKSQQQIYASIDFAYNVGHNAFANYVVDINNEVDCVKMMDYVNFNGKESNGLKKRRFENFIQCNSFDEII